MRRLAEKLIGLGFMLSGACWVLVKLIDRDLAKREAARVEQGCFLHLLDDH